MIHRVSCELGGKTLFIETGKMAKQAQGSVLVGYGDTRVLVTACVSSNPKDVNFMPLTVEFQEKYYASGKIPGGFHKREARPTNDAILSARLIDRPIRPLFPEGFTYETQVIASILSVDLESDIDVAAGIGASAALHISKIPFNGPTASIRMGRIDGKFVVNPTWKEVNEEITDMEIFISGTEKAIMMVEGGAREVPEADVLAAILQGHQEIKKVTKIIQELRNLCGEEKMTFEPKLPSDAVKSIVEKTAKTEIAKALRTKEKAARYEIADAAKEKAVAAVLEANASADDSAKKKLEADAKTAFELVQYNQMREMILTDGRRIDGRDTKSIRPIAVDTGLLPRTHGSSLFTRGETQVLGVVTLGTADDEQIIDTMYQNTMKRFMLHYNFPPFSVGEAGRAGFTSRREIGHGALAERSIKAIMPAHEKFPYTVRIVCETLESNGSSSMGSVCAASMALMDAGVPYPKPVAGIAMGLIKEKDRVAVLSDILGDEDFLGDMDFKVAGTKDGVTGIQMDIKIEGVDEQIMRTALAQAKEGRVHILGEMAKNITEARTQMSMFAPRITSIKIPVDRIGELIGPGGKTIKDIVARTGAKIDIQDDGTVNVASNDGAVAQKALDIIQGMMAEAEIGATYKGVVKKIVEFGAFVAILPNQEGLLHVSEIAHERVNNVTDYLKEGDEVEVKVLEVDPRSGKIRLSRRALLEVPEGVTPRPPSGPREDRGDRGDRGGRGGGGGRGGDRGRGPRR